MTKANTTATTQKHPTDPKTLAAALLAWRETNPSAPKNGRNPHFKSSFSNFEDVVECVNTATEYGITWTQTTDFIVVENGVVDFIVTKSGMCQAEKWSKAARLSKSKTQPIPKLWGLVLPMPNGTDCKPPLASHQKKTTATPPPKQRRQTSSVSGRTSKRMEVHMQSSKPVIAPSFKSGIPVPEKRSSGKYDWLKAWAVNDCIDVNSRREANNICARAYLQKPWGREGKNCDTHNQHHKRQICPLMEGSIMYDKTDSGAAYPVKETQKMILGGPINDNGNETQVAVIKSQLPDGRSIFDLYQKVGTLFDNESENPKAPAWTGPWNGRRIAVWTAEKDDGAGNTERYMSLKISDKRTEQASPEAKPTPIPEKAEPLDDIPF